MSKVARVCPKSSYAPTASASAAQKWWWCYLNEKFELERALCCPNGFLADFDGSATLASSSLSLFLRSFLAASKEMAFDASSLSSELFHKTSCSFSKIAGAQELFTRKKSLGNSKAVDIMVSPFRF